jgi:hypothetical protein
LVSIRTMLLMVSLSAVLPMLSRERISIG